MSRPLGIVLPIVAAFCTLGLAWWWLAAHDLLTLGTLMALLEGSVAWRDAPWAVLVVMAVYVGASLVMFPLSLLVALTGLLFGPWWGFAYALAGTLTTSALTWWIGRRLGHEVLLRHGGRHLHGLARYLSGRGIRTMTLVNLFSLAPFILTNLLAGAFRLRFRDYMIGSTLGIIPALVGVTLLGSQLGQLATAESRADLLWGLGGLLLGVALLVGLKRRAERRRRNR